MTLETVVETMNKGFAGMNHRFDLVDDRLDGHDRQFEEIGRLFNQHGVLVEAIDDKIIVLAEGHKMLYDKIVEVDRKVEAIDTRLEAAEITIRLNPRPI